MGRGGDGDHALRFYGAYLFRKQIRTCFEVVWMFCILIP